MWDHTLLLATRHKRTHPALTTATIQCESKNPPYGFLKKISKRLGIFNQFLHTYYTIFSTLDCKFLFRSLQLCQSYAILSAARPPSEFSHFTRTLTSKFAY